MDAADVQAFEACFQVGVMLVPYFMHQDVVLDEDDALKSLQYFGHCGVELPGCRWCAHYEDSCVSGSNKNWKNESQQSSVKKWSLPSRLFHSSLSWGLESLSEQDDHSYFVSILKRTSSKLQPFFVMTMLYI